jgi:hypothetical protein
MTTRRTDTVRTQTIVGEGVTWIARLLDAVGAQHAYRTPKIVCTKISIWMHKTQEARTGGCGGDLDQQHM